MESILLSTKKVLGVDGDYDHFDLDIITAINASLMTLNQVGVGPSTGLSITGDTETWTDLLGERKDLAAVRTYVQLSARLIFDPPAASFILEAFKRQLDEILWRIDIQVSNGGDIVE